MELVQSRIVTGDVAGLAGFYASLVGTDVVVNDFYVEVPTGAAVALSRMHFSELGGQCGPPAGSAVGEVVLDFPTEDLDSATPASARSASTGSWGRPCSRGAGAPCCCATPRATSSTCSPRRKGRDDDCSPMHRPSRRKRSTRSTRVVSMP